jgi:hypothetical protein
MNEERTQKVGKHGRKVTTASEVQTSSGRNPKPQVLFLAVGEVRVIITFVSESVIKILF